ncbi:RING finger protein unkempt [Trichonephila clavipes]|nr:RING finger protein unkempt [Trichonephila clavipes]
MGLQFLFMDDNAPCHRTVAAEQFLESEDIERMDWPARSPDLNPIEHVWDFLGRRLAARTLPPVTIRELRLALQDEWAAMPQQLIDTLILSMGRRCETCLAVYQTYEVWKREAEEASRRERLAEQQRDEALAKANSLQKELDELTGGPFLHTLIRISELETLPLIKLKQLQEQLREDLEKIEKVLFYQTATKCMICEDRNRSITVVPCSHYVLCNQCAPHQKNCPYCHEEITSLSNASL